MTHLGSSDVVYHIVYHHPTHLSISLSLSPPLSLYLSLFLSLETYIPFPPVLYIYYTFCVCVCMCFSVCRCVCVCEPNFISEVSERGNGGGLHGSEKNTSIYPKPSPKPYTDIITLIHNIILIIYTKNHQILVRYHLLLLYIFFMCTFLLTFDLILV